MMQENIKLNTLRESERAHYAALENKSGLDVSKESNIHITEKLYFLSRFKDVLMVGQRNFNGLI
jgi:hypothetical protein